MMICMKDEMMGMKSVSWIKRLLCISLSLLMVLSISGCQSHQTEKPENVLLLTPEQLGFYEELYEEDLPAVLKALDLTEDDLRDPSEVMDVSFADIYYLLPDVVEYNGVSFYFLLAFASTGQDKMEPNTFRGIWLAAQQADDQQITELSEQLFEAAQELYGEPSGTYANSILNPYRKEQFLSGEQGFSDLWYLNDNRSYAKISASIEEDSKQLWVRYEINLLPEEMME